MNKSSEHLKLARMTAEIVRRLRNPFVLHMGIVPRNLRGGASHYYVSFLEEVRADHVQKGCKAATAPSCRRALLTGVAYLH